MKMLVQTSKDPYEELEARRDGWGLKGMDAQELGFVCSAGGVVCYQVSEARP